MRRHRLASAAKEPPLRFVTTIVFLRNPDVVAEVLTRANGICEECGDQAPFFRKTDHSPYLEVHHRVQLANGGEDTVQNAIALCPNCHRKKHHGEMEP
jgi:5-methylcytosine-specific restriction protein A